MSEYVSWLGTGNVYGSAGTRVREEIPTTFSPTDISGCVIWMDGNDTNAVNANPFGQVESWFNKGDLSGNFDLSGSAAVRYGDRLVNGLEVVTFSGSSYLTATYALDFQDRSMFIVSRRNQAIDVSSNIFTWFTADTVGGQETGILQSGASYQYILSQHPGAPVLLDFATSVDTTGYAELATFVNSSTDVSGNYLGLNAIQQTATVNNLASGYTTTPLQYYLGNFFGLSTLPNDYDMAELILYNKALSPIQIEQVQNYLMSKWAIVAPPPAPFAPTDIAGLQVWLDGSNVSSLSLSGTDVLSWSNVGSAGGSFVQTNGVAVYGSSRVAMPPGATLDAYFQLPYYSRTLFAVLEPVDDLSLVGYPYMNFMDGQASDGRQAGLSYDSGGGTFQFTICQSGTNCPVVAPFNPMPAGLVLVAGVVDSNDSLNNAGYLNNGSNINTSADLGNLFNQNPIPYVIGSSNPSGPAFRMAEFLEYDTVLSASNVSTITSYLSDKWGLGL